MPRLRLTLRAALFIPLFLVFFLAHPPASADCECGYALRPPHIEIWKSGQPSIVFTEVTESNFGKLGVGDIGQNTDWVPQAFNLTETDSRGTFGQTFTVDNVKLGSNAEGLKLVVGSALIGGKVPGAEMDTSRLDMAWGTFRASIKLTDVRGTCAAFFWVPYLCPLSGSRLRDSADLEGLAQYFNDTQEIDVEFLSKEFEPKNNSYPINLVLQSPEAEREGFDASKTANFVKVYLPFNPTTDFHKYRIDYLPGQVVFYADGMELAHMNGPAVPISSGHLILRHWSNGNGQWSGGPPMEDAVMAVRYVKAYFNSSTPRRFNHWARRCRNPSAHNAVCPIPDLTPNSLGAADWFFSENWNMTNNQTVYQENSVGERKSPGIVWLLLLFWAWHTTRRQCLFYFTSKCL